MSWRAQNRSKKKFFINKACFLYKINRACFLYKIIPRIINRACFFI
jgi:hypothetical protein